MEWIINNWVLLLFLALCLGMHFLGGGHGRHGKHEDKGTDTNKGHSGCH